MAAPVVQGVGSYITEGNGASAAVPVPSGVAANDIIWVSMHKESTATVTPPSGFTLYGGAPVALATPGFWNYLYWKRATGADSGTYSFTWTGSVWRTAFAVRVSGCVTTGDPTDVATNATNSSASTTTQAVSLTTTGADRLLIWLCDLWDVSAYTSPTGYTRPTITGWPSSRLLDIGYATQAVAGATGSVSGTLGTARQNIARLVALIPAASTTAPTVDAGADVSNQVAGTVFTRTGTDVSDGGATITSRAWTITAGPTGVGSTIGTAAALSWTPTVTGSYTLQYAATNSVGTGTDTMNITVAPGPPPSNLFTLSNFHLTLPVDSSGGTSGTANEIDQPALTGFADDYFYLDSAGRMVFIAPVNAATTSGSTAGRSELRQREKSDYSNTAFDPNTTGRRQITLTTRADPTSITGGTNPRQEMIVCQVHGASGTPPLYMAAEWTSSGVPLSVPRLKMFLSGTGLTSTVVVPAISTTMDLSIRLRVESATVKVWVQPGPAAYLPPVTSTPSYSYAASAFTDQSSWYFKAGAYNKTDTGTGSSGQAMASISYLQVLDPSDSEPTSTSTVAFAPFFAAV